MWLLTSITHTGGAFLMPVWRQLNEFNERRADKGVYAWQEIAADEHYISLLKYFF